MSCNNSENGNIEFTKSGYQVVLTAFRKAYNDYIDSVYASALSSYDKLAAIKGGSASKKRREAFKAMKGYNSDYYSEMLNGKAIPCDLMCTINDEMFRGANGALTKPRRSHFPKLTNKDRSFDLGEFSFNDSKTTVVGLEVSSKGNREITNTSQPRIEWRVDENNHAVEAAHACPLSKLLFNNVLRNYKWKKGEGGVFYYLDEYDIDSARDYGGQVSSSISHHFGPKGKKIQDDATDNMLRMAGFKRRRRA